MTAYKPVQGWEDKEGTITLTKIGVKEGDVVLDFGCRVGRYTLPASIVAGDHGRVYALDKDEKALQVLEEQAIKDGLKNIIPVLTEGELQLQFQDRTIDFVMVYDVMHHMSKPDRVALLQEMKRVLKDTGILSVTLFHNELFKDKEGNAGHTVHELVEEIQEIGYTLQRELADTVIHFECDGAHYKKTGDISLDILERGTAFNFQSVRGQPMNNVDSKTLSREQYTKHAEGYITSKAHAKAAELTRLVEIARPQPNWNVLDVATGGGHTALAFAPHVAQVVATDLTPRMLEKAAAHTTGQGVTNVEFKLADAENLPFDDEIFDLVTCRIAPHHFPDCARFVREGARVLKPGGLLLVQDHVLPDDEEAARAVDDFERLRDPSHNRAFDADEWRGMFEDAGLAVEHAEQIVKRHEFIPWAERQGCTPEVIEQLIEMMRQAPVIAVNWMQPQDWGTSEATFVNHHIIIAGRKGQDG